MNKYKLKLFNGVSIVGAGLAGCEAALQIAKRNIPVRIYEMKPKKFTEAHKSPEFSELVCSNSLKSDSPEKAAGILKNEMLSLGSIVLESALKHRVPAGGALGVDRKEFSKYIIYLDGNYQFPKPKKITANISNNHKKYAITWFSLAISILLLYLYFRKKNF